MEPRQPEREQSDRQRIALTEAEVVVVDGDGRFERDIVRGSRYGVLAFLQVNLSVWRAVVPALVCRDIVRGQRLSQWGGNAPPKRSRAPVLQPNTLPACDRVDSEG